MMQPKEEQEGMRERERERDIGDNVKWENNAAFVYWNQREDLHLY